MSNEMKINKEHKNILIAGVGGQGLVLSTRMLGAAAFKEGYDVKTSDVIGLSQRGGKIWGSVRFGDEVLSPLIPIGQCDLMLGMEKLEALRWLHYMKADATLVLNDSMIFPNRVLTEKEEYPADIETTIKNKCKLIPVDGHSLAKQAGNEKTINTVLLGVLSRYLPFSEETWIEVITENVPKKTVEMNLAAFKLGASVVVKPS